MNTKPNGKILVIRSGAIGDFVLTLLGGLAKAVRLPLWATVFRTGN